MPLRGWTRNGRAVERKSVIPWTMLSLSVRWREGLSCLRNMSVNRQGGFVPHKIALFWEMGFGKTAEAVCHNLNDAACIVTDGGRTIGYLFRNTLKPLAFSGALTSLACCSCGGSEGCGCAAVRLHCCKPFDMPMYRSSFLATGFGKIKTCAVFFFFFLGDEGFCGRTWREF